MKSALLLLPIAFLGCIESPPPAQTEPEVRRAQLAIAEFGEGHDPAHGHDHREGYDYEHGRLHGDKPGEDTGLPGPFPLPTKAGYFLEEKGIAEEIPECHPFHGNDKTCGNATHQPAGDIWEVCDKNGYLIETGPAVGAADFPCHDHVNGVGHPIRVDCEAYCQAQWGGPTGDTYNGWCDTQQVQCGGAKRDVGYCVCELVNICPGDEELDEQAGAKCGDDPLEPVEPGSVPTPA